MAQLTRARVTIDNQEIDNFISLDILQEVYDLSSFHISYELETLENPDDFIIERTKNFIGKTCTINTEFRELGSSSTTEGFNFRGIVTEVHSSRSGMRSGDIIVIRGNSPDIILKGKPTCRTFKDQTLEQIVNSILQPYPRNLLNPNVSPRNTNQLAYTVQYMESDYEFLRRIAVRYGEWFFYNGQELNFGALPDSDETELGLGNDLDNFHFDLKTGPSSNAFRYVHDSDKEILSWESGNNNVEQILNEYARHAYSESGQLFTEQANRTFNHLNTDPGSYQEALESSGTLEESTDAMKLSGASGTGTNLGLKIGQEISITRQTSGGSSQNYGRYRLTKLSHFCDQVLNYENSFTAMSAESDIPENANPNAVRRSGPVRGQVMDNADPEKYGRVMVDYGWISGQQDTTPWIRVITPYVMNQGGNFFVPEIGSDVLVAFEDGDMERPYVLGAFNTSPNQFCPDPAWGDETPNIKAIRTASGHTIEFHDVEGSERIRIYDMDQVNEIILDPANNELRIVASESLIIEARQIEINAEEGIKINAGDKVEVESRSDIELKGTNLNVEAQADMAISALNVDIAANAQFKAAGNAGSELTSSAILTLRGSLVNIN